MACIECRRRRIKCDAVKPSCNHCTRLNKACQYAQVEQKRGPKRRSIKELGDRIAQLEARLKSHEFTSTVPEQNTGSGNLEEPDFDIDFGDLDFTLTQSNPDTIPIPWTITQGFDFNDIGSEFQQPILLDNDTPDSSNELGLTETSNSSVASYTPGEYPDFATVSELYDQFFEYDWPLQAFVQKDKHDPKNWVASGQQPPLCLQYAMWALGAGRSSKYRARANEFYRSARMHLEHDELESVHLEFVTLAHVQAWLLMASYEAENALPSRSWMSNKRAVAISQMLNLHRLDSDDVTAQKMLPSVSSFADIEECRRTFWYLYSCDRWSSAGIGRRPTVADHEITTHLPAPDEAFHLNLPETGQKIQDVIKNGLNVNCSVLTISALCSWLLGQIMNHFRASAGDSVELAVEKDFWIRHDRLDNILTQMQLNMPPQHRYQITKEPGAFFLNMAFHEFSISLHNAAIVYAKQECASFETIKRLRDRTRKSAETIIDVQRHMSFMDVRKMFPYTPSALYMAAIVFIKDYEEGRDQKRAKEVLRYIVHTMVLFTRHYKAAELFLTQTRLHLKTSGIQLEDTSVPVDDKMLEDHARFSEDFKAFGPLFSSEQIFEPDGINNKGVWIRSFFDAA